MDQRHVVRLLAVARVAIGVVAIAAPRRAGSLVLGSRGRDRGVALIVRAFGVRDLVLGLGTLRALDQDADPATWAKLSAACDAADAAAALLAAPALSPARVVLGAGSATTAAALGARASNRLA